MEDVESLSTSESTNSVEGNELAILLRLFIFVEIKLKRAQ